MEKVIEKAAVLIEALPYIKRFQGKLIVVKYGGSTMGEEDMMNSVLTDIVFLRLVGLHPILIHGGGKAITEEMKSRGLKPQFISGLRVTNKQTMKIVEDVLINTIGADIVRRISAQGAKAREMNIHTEKFLIVRKFYPIVKSSIGKEEKKDIGFVGEIDHVEAQPILDLCREGTIPIISPLGIDKKGDIYNVNGDSMAGAISSALKAEKLVLLTNVRGIIKDFHHTEKHEENLISTIEMSQIDEMIENKIIIEGMIPKVNACRKALMGGVNKAHIIDGRLLHGILLEIFTDCGVGTEIVN